MTQIVLNDQQWQAFQAGTGAVEIRDPQGRLLGYVSRPVDRAELEEVRRRLDSSGPWYTTQQVLDHLKSLEQG